MRILDLDTSASEMTNEQMHAIFEEQAKSDPEQLDSISSQFSVKQLKNFIRFKVGGSRMRSFKEKTGYSQSRTGVTEAIFYLYGTAPGRTVARTKPEPKKEKKKDTWKSGPIYDGETLLEDDFPVYPGYVYVVDGRPMESMVTGTVRHLKADIYRHHGHEVSEVRRCDIGARMKSNRSSL